MDFDFLETLPQFNKDKIERLYDRLQDKQINFKEFYSQCHEFLGDFNFRLLFPQNTALTEPEEVQREVKTEELQDIIQYAGVDLKEEHSKIYGETEHLFLGSVADNEEDYRSNMESLVNTSAFFDFANRIGISRGIKVSNGCYYVLFTALRRKLSDFMEKLIEASKLRVDVNKSKFICEIENDMKRQLWVLDQLEKKELENYKFKKNDEDGRASKKITIEREDIMIKKRMCNSVALAALGGGQKSWMMVGEGILDKEEESVLQSLYSPYNEKEMETRMEQRSICMDDFMYVLETDKIYAKSIFTICQKYNFK